MSLWLDTMVKGLSAPWFGLRLRRGNSLIGARRATYSQSQVKDKSWLTATPTDVPLTELAENIDKGIAFSATSSRIHHFLLPAQGWGSATEVPKDVAALAPEAVTALKTWRRSMKTKPTAKQIQRLVALGERVEKLWQFALRRLRIAEAESSRTIELWGRETPEHTPVGVARADRGVPGRRERRLSPVATRHGPLVRPVVLAVDRDRRSSRRRSRSGSAPARRSSVSPRRRSTGGWTRSPGTRPPGRASTPRSRTTSTGAAPSRSLRCGGSIRGSRLPTEWLARQGFFHWDLDFATGLRARRLRPSGREPALGAPHRGR